MSISEIILFQKNLSLSRIFTLDSEEGVEDFWNDIIFLF